MSNDLVLSEIATSLENGLTPELSSKVKSLSQKQKQRLLGGLLAVDNKIALQAFIDIEKYNCYRLMAGIAGQNKHWAGIPVVVPNLPLILEPHYPLDLNGCYVDDNDKMQQQPPDDDDGFECVNVFFSTKHRAWVYIIKSADGKIRWSLNNFNVNLTRTVQTIGATYAWTLDAELTAVEKLRTLVTEIAYKAYMLTGSFLETSKRSQVTYVFRKLRPTLALATRPNGIDMHLLCALCLHPVGMYDGTWAGCMTPTDDVIAHVLMMRGDERHYWSKANQHAPWSPEAGI